MYLQMELMTNPGRRTHLMTTALFVAYATINFCIAVYGTATA